MSLRVKSPRKARNTGKRPISAELSPGDSTGQTTASTGHAKEICQSFITGKNPPFPGGAKIIPADPDALFLPYQSRWINDNSRLKLMEKARQIGLSWSTGYRRVREQSRSKRRWDTWVSSRDEGQAVLFLQDCRQWAELLQIGAKDLGEKVYEDETGRPFKAFEMETANGRILHSMSSNPNAQAGKRGDRVLDEFALHQDPRKMYAIAYPGLTWGGQMEMISTHRGNLNFFAQLVREIKEQENPKKISLHTCTLQDALDQGFLYKLQRKLWEADPTDERIFMDEADYFNMVRRECPDEESFLQEFCCIPADDRTAFLEWDMIAAAEYGPHELWEIALPEILGELYIGVDVGRRHDLTVIWILERLGGYMYTRRVIELKNTRFAAQEDILWPLIAHPRCRRCCIDATGLGMQLAERSQEKFSQYRVEAVTLMLGICFWGEGRWKSRWPDRRAGKKGLSGTRRRKPLFPCFRSRSLVPGEESRARPMHGRSHRPRRCNALPLASPRSTLPQSTRRRSRVRHPLCRRSARPSPPAIPTVRPPSRRWRIWMCSCAPSGPPPNAWTNSVMPSPRSPPKRMDRSPWLMALAGKKSAPPATWPGLTGW